MNGVKYHIITFISVCFFSFASAITFNQFIRFVFIDRVAFNHTSQQRRYRNRETVPSFDDYKSVFIESGFFKMPDLDSPDSGYEEVKPETPLMDLKLIGTISGPRSIARALVQKKGERDAEIFSTGADVFGYKLLKVRDTCIYLSAGDKTEKIDIYDERNWGRGRKPRTRNHSVSGSTVNKTISRAELKQKALNNVDNAIKGLRAGPYRKNDKIEGYRLIRVRPYNILYKLGMRSGDIVKRINGHKITGTKKLYSLWGSLQDAPQVTVDVDRRGSDIHFNFSIRN